MMKTTESKLAKRLTSALFTLVLLGAGGFATDVRAQSAGVFEIQVPFDFVVKGRTYEAGRYLVGRLNQANPDTLVLKAAAGKRRVILQTQRGVSGAPVKFSKLTFSRYGETHFLDGIQASGESYASRLPSAQSDRRRRGPAQLLEVVGVTRK